jgi:hypothetical protein
MYEYSSSQTRACAEALQSRLEVLNGGGAGRAEDLEHVLVAARKVQTTISEPHHKIAIKKNSQTKSTKLKHDEFTESINKKSIAKKYIWNFIHERVSPPCGWLQNRGRAAGDKLQPYRGCLEKPTFTIWSSPSKNVANAPPVSCSNPPMERNARERSCCSRRYG